MMNPKLEEEVISDCCPVLCSQPCPTKQQEKFKRDLASIERDKEVYNRHRRPRNMLCI